MVEGLPVDRRPEWERLWRDYSQLKGGTRMSFLDGLSQGRDQAWRELTDRYEGLIRKQFLRISGQGWLIGTTADDLLQQFYLALFERLPRFERQRVGSFRRWLRLLAADVFRHRARPDGLRPLAGFADRLEDDRSDPSLEWDREHQRHVLERAMAEVESRTSAAHFQVFLALWQKSPNETVEQVAARLGVSRANADKIKSRILTDIKFLLEQWGERG